MRGQRLLLRAASLLLLAAPAIASAEPTCMARADARDSRSWPSPLDRLVTLHGRDLALRDALDRLAAAAHLRLSYSAELLPLDHRVCVSADSVAAGVVLSELLEGSAVAPVVAGNDQVVLAPATPRHQTTTHAEQSVNMLDRVFVSGQSLGVSPRGSSAAVTSIDRTQLAKQGGGTLSEALNGAVPGYWLWDQAPSSLIAQYGSLRGASSFGVSAPKVYIDGIEVANPLLLTELSPDAVERIDVIRGPQGAALYGADAIAGVVNIVMRHDGGDGGELARLRSTAGMSHSVFASRPVLVQEHTLALHGGGDVKSSVLSLSLGSVGSYVPGGQSWNAHGDGGFRLVGERSMLTGSARFYAKDAGVSTSPLIASSSPSVSPMQSDRDAWREMGHGYDRPQDGASANATQSIREYTLGTTGTLSTGERWSHVLTVGIDGYRLSGDPTATMTSIPSPLDSALRAARGSADRATFRATSEGRFGAADGAAATLSFAAEHSALQQHSAYEMLPQADRSFSGWESNTGIIGQLDASWRNMLFATSGLRFERDGGFGAMNGLVSLPMFGGAAVHEFGPVMTKLRASYGKSIRPVGSALRSSWIGREALLQTGFAPEEQAGVEAGIDATVGHAFALHLTRFDQTAYSLIQPVLVKSTLLPSPDADGPMMYALQDVGQISNRGWELESSFTEGRLSVGGTMSLVDSRIRRLAFDYRGDLQTGDRMLGVPAVTTGLTTTWTALRWSTSLTLARAQDWIDYDALALAMTPPDGRPTGAALRQYWRVYPGVTRFDASFSRQFFSGFTIVFSGRNLLDVQRGEPDNLTVLPGRTISAGLEAKF
ncbi:MAG TPA: TonB-dependent receptor plug domain-containing protein [Gemmatimonadaceae bacterium]